MPHIEDDLRSDREFTKELIADSEADLKQGKIPRNRVHLVQNSLGGDYRDLGIIASLLNEEVKAREQFAEATGHYLSGVRTARERQDEISRGNRESEPTILLKALYCGILSNDDELLTEAANETLAMDSAYVTEFPETVYKYHAAKALASVALDAEEARTHIDSLRDSLDGLRPELGQFFRAIATVADGIVGTDGETVAEGVQQLLDHHTSTFGSEPTTIGQAISVPATALLSLARRKGIDVTVENEHLLSSNGRTD